MKKLYLPVLAVLALASCSKSELAVRPDNGQVEIKATSQALTIDTRTPFEGQIGADNNLKAYVMMSKVTGDYTSGNIYGKGTMTFTDNDTNPVGFDDTPQYYPTDDSKLYMSALYPSPIDSWTSIGTTAKFTFNGSQDVMAAAQVETQKSTAASKVPSFIFKHLLTKLTVKVVAENEAAVTAWGDIVGLSVIQGNGSNVNSSVEVTLADGTAVTTDGVFATPIGVDKNGMSFYTITDGTNYTDDAVDDADNKITPTTVATLAAYSLVAPIIATGTNDFQLKVLTKTATQDEAVASTPFVHLKTTGGADSSFTGDTQGKAFEITIKLKATEIVAQAKVIDWVEGGSADVEIQ